MPLLFKTKTKDGLASTLAIPLQPFHLRIYGKQFVTNSTRSFSQYRSLSSSFKRSRCRHKSTAITEYGYVS